MTQEGKVYYLLVEVCRKRGCVKRGVRYRVHCIDLGSAFNEKLSHLQTREERILTLLKQVLALERVVPHHGEMKEGISGRCSRIDSVHDVMNPASKRDVIVVTRDVTVAVVV